MKHLQVRIFSFLLALLLSTGAMAQITIELPEYVDFNGFTGTNLNSVFLGWDEGNGFPSPQYGTSGWYLSEELFDNAAGVSLNSNTHREWIISPRFAATANTKLSFEMAITRFYDDPALGHFGYDDSLSVMVSTDAINFEPVFTLNMLSEMSNQMQLYEVDLSNYAGENIQIAFYATDGMEETGNCALHLDNVTLWNSGAKDARVVQFLSPVANECYSNEQEVTVQLINDGNATLSSIPVRVRIRGTLNQNLYGVYAGSLAPGEVTELTVGTFDMTTPGQYQLSAFAELPGDAFAMNDSVNNQVFYNPASYELPLPVLHFTTYYTANLSEIHPGWYEARGDEFPLVRIDTDWQGDEWNDQKTASVYFTNLGTEDWMIGPKFTVAEYSRLTFEASIEYDMGTQMGSDDKLAIMISDDCGASWTEIDAVTQTSGISANNFTTIDVDLSAYDGQEVILALYATTNSEMDFEKYIFHIDNVSIHNFYPVDGGVTSLLAPTNACSFTNAEPVVAEITNFGSTAISGFTAAYSLNGGTAVEETVNATIQPNDTYEYTFNATVDLTQQNNNSLSIWTEVEDDYNPTNDGLEDVSVITSSFNLATQGTYSNGFEDENTLQGWVVENTNNDPKTWERLEDSQYANNGTFSYYYESNGTSTQSNDWLISECFALETGATYYVEFYYRNRATSYPEKLELMLGDAQNSTAMSTELIDLGEISNSTYEMASTTFQVTADGSYYFGWHAYGANDQFGMHVDDVVIYQVFDTDAAVTGLIIPRTKDENTCELLPTEEAYVDVFNQGTTTISSIPISMQLNGGTTLNQTFTETLAPGETVTLTFDNGLSISPDEVYDVVATAGVSGDLNTANNAMELNNFTLQNYATSFEAGQDISEWTQESLEGSNTWEVISEADVTHTGQSCYGIRTDSYNGNTGNDDWLISECFYLEAGVCYEIGFWYRSRYSTENLEVFIGDANTASAMTESLLDLGDFNSNTYLYAETQFSVEESGAYYFSWHTDGGTSGRYWVYVDDVSVVESSNMASISPQHTVLDAEVLFEANGENTTLYEWDFGDGTTSTLENPSHHYSEPGTYTVTLTSGNSCAQLTETLDVTISCDVEAGFSFDVNDFTVDFTATSSATGYEWDFGDSNFSAEQNPTHTYSESDTYTVTLTAFEACGTAQHQADIAISSVQQLAEYGISLFPNPVNKTLSVKAPVAIQQIVISDVSGKVVMQETAGSKAATFDVGTLPQGTYIVRIETADAIWHTTVVKQ